MGFYLLSIFYPLLYTFLKRNYWVVSRMRVHPGSCVVAGSFVMQYSELELSKQLATMIVGLA